MHEKALAWCSVASDKTNGHYKILIKLASSTYKRCTSVKVNYFIENSYYIIVVVMYVNLNSS